MAGAGGAINDWRRMWPQVGMMWFGQS